LIAVNRRAGYRPDLVPLPTFTAAEAKCRIGCGKRSLAVH